MLRTGARTLELVQSERPLFAVGPDDLFRNAGIARARRLGGAARDEGHRACSSTTELFPKRLRFELDRDLEDPSFQWIAEGEEGFREEKPPPVGYGAPVMP